ncbi:hypothetical protein [Amycolatopsis taiwanensis]|uniref:Uncharacterized protein n=1 Tax=Amycolatopsis taiwanensis TaxID=342230 RepID=A0A9W6R1X7_9PSEU|nr:hypothetical protein [Amycolatopsis taiwanensis]GLY66913.1 hypothetical protein Atai01_35320 [Amycolatopsis taiwanensis]
MLARQMPGYGNNRILSADNADQGGDPYQQIRQAARLTAETK